MKFTYALTVLIYAAASSPASALEDHERVQVATALGNVLAFEEACDLKYNQDAIAAFIEARVPADDIEFPGILSTMSGGAKYLLKNLTGSEKTAQCAQIRRIAKSYGFTR